MKHKYPVILLLSLLLSITPAAEILSSTGEEAVFTSFLPLSGNSFLAGTENHGILFSDNRGLSFTPRNEGIPGKVVWPWNGRELRIITGLAGDPSDSGRVLALTPVSLHYSENGGLSWVEIALSNPVRSTNYLTSAALVSGDRNRIVLGTSFNGIFESSDSGKTWKRLQIQGDPLSRGANFYEEISGLAVDPDNLETLYIAAGFGSGIYRYSYASRQMTEIPSPEGGAAQDDPVRSLFFSDGYLHGAGRRSVYRYGDGGWTMLSPPLVTGPPSPGMKEIGRHEKAAEKTGIYLNSLNVSGSRFDAHVEMMKKHGFNSFVVDAKNDFGFVTYNSELEIVRATGALRPRFDLEELLKTAKEEGLYVIARIVVFQDMTLYRYQQNVYAVWDANENGPWGNRITEINPETEEERLVQREFWVDPYSSFVWNYNIEIARELQERGVDEIQFDYIRFPSDGNIAAASYRAKREGMVRADALESFLRKARAEIHIPISTDLYGFNSWYRMGSWIGQNIEMFSRYVDVISPMYYPSHFPRNFLNNGTYLERAEEIYRTGTERAKILVSGRSLIRPYVQAFLIGNELSMERPGYTDYLLRQINGSRESNSSGYTLWNNSNRYYMIPDTFSAIPR